MFYSAFGWFCSGFADNLSMLYLFYSGFAGAGNGMLYNTIVAVVTKWFPDKRGLANGVCIGAIGLGPMIFAPAGNWLIETFDVSTAFHIVGAVWLVVYLCSRGYFTFLLQDGRQKVGVQKIPLNTKMRF